MANIGATTAFYKVETSLTRANNEVSKSMERLATGKQNANAGDRSSYVAMADTFRLDYVGTKAGIKGASVAMGYLETGMRVLDAASALLGRLQELAVLGANNTNTTQDSEAINLEAEAIADEFNRLMTTSTYKGKDVFVSQAGNQEIAMGGRGAEMTFGIGEVSYTALYAAQREIDGGPNDGIEFNIANLPSDAVVAKSYGAAASQENSNASALTLTADSKYILRSVDSTDEIDMSDATNAASAVSVKTAILSGKATLTDASGTASDPTFAEGDILSVSTEFDVSTVAGTGPLLTWTESSDPEDNGAVAASVTADTYLGVTGTGGTSGSTATFDVTIDADGDVTNVVLKNAGDDFDVGETITILGGAIGGADGTDLELTVASVSSESVTFAKVNTGANAFQSGETYVIQTLGTSTGNTATASDDAAFIAAAFTDESGNQLTGTLGIGDKIKMASVGDVIGGTTITQKHLDAANALIQGMTFTKSTGTLTANIESVQSLINKARVQAGSQYAALESAVSYTTDLTAQYELGYNMVNDVNFSAETAHLAKNQILQQAATAMLAQANSGQQGLLQLIQG